MLVELLQAIAQSRSETQLGALSIEAQVVVLYGAQTRGVLVSPAEKPAQSGSRVQLFGQQRPGCGAKCGFCRSPWHPRNSSQWSGRCCPGWRRRRRGFSTRGA